MDRSRETVKERDRSRDIERQRKVGGGGGGKSERGEVMGIKKP